MGIGPGTLFNRRLEDLPIALMDSGGDTFKMTLHDAAEALAATFLGGSGNCTYADLAHELTTGSGYTAGGLTLTSVGHTRSATVESWLFDYAQWTLSGTVNARYAVVRDSTTGLLIAFVDLDTSLGAGVNQAFPAGFLKITPNAAGFLKWERV